MPGGVILPSPHTTTMHPITFHIPCAGTPSSQPKKRGGGTSSTRHNESDVPHFLVLPLSQTNLISGN